MITRFAPSPTGFLHLGHAYSALFAHDRVQSRGGELMLRVEDIDQARARPEYREAIFEDLFWLGIAWHGDVMVQSERRGAYDAALARLVALDVCFPCRCTRRDIRANLSAPHDDTSAIIYPGTCRDRPMSEAGERDAIRLDMRRALDRLADGAIRFEDKGPLHSGLHRVARETLVADTGDIVLARKDIGTSYNLAAVVDDAAQGITEVVRGADLLAVTPVQRLLQDLLQLPAPSYCHHGLIRDRDGVRLAKRANAAAIRDYRAQGVSPAALRGMLGLVTAPA